MQSGSFQHCERGGEGEGDIKIIEREREESFGCIGYKGAFIELVLTISFFLFFFLPVDESRSLNCFVFV